MMLVGYDGRFITDSPTGNGIYATRLIETLSRLDDRNRYRVYFPGSPPANLAGLRDNVDFRAMPTWHRYAWFRVPISFPYELMRRRVDIFHAHYTVPPMVRAKVVLTLHDFFWIVHPEYFVSYKRIPLTYTVRRAIARADRILVGSSFIRQEALEHFAVEEERVVVIPYGVDEGFFQRQPDDRLNAVHRKYGVEDAYVLAVGDMHPRKNLERLLQAFARMPRRQDVKLLLVGKPLWKAKRLRECIEAVGLTDRAITTGYVPAEDLPALYQGAEVFCYPSLYEGFGFPILEAMASGVPVAASNASSCPGVGGEAAAYFEPTDVDAIADTLTRLLDSSQLRADMARAGVKWARTFTWEQTARRTMDVYRSLG